MTRVSYTLFYDIATRCNQCDSNLANLEATVEVGKILELLSLTMHWQHVHGEHFKFHEVV